MAGDAGTRLWPVSREKTPEQFIALPGNGLSTCQTTVRRVSGADGALADRGHRPRFSFHRPQQLQALGAQGEIVLEPERHDSTPTVAVGDLMAAGEEWLLRGAGGRACHRKRPGFNRGLQACGNGSARRQYHDAEYRADKPVASYGYIAVGAASEQKSALMVDRFFEKPDVATATGHLDHGMLWKSGNFLRAGMGFSEEGNSLANGYGAVMRISATPDLAQARPA